jgi:hypothetical protein
MRTKLIVVFLLGIAVGIAVTATVWRPTEQSGRAARVGRDLTAEELEQVTGLIGIRNDGALCGDLYNGNEALSVTSVELRIVSFAGSDSTDRRYTYVPTDSALAPLATQEFCMRFLLNQGEDFSWGIVTARGREQ